MKDRQPTQVLSNGAIRYGIYNADGTLNHYEYMKRDDAPTVEGTPLSKANLLSDATATKIWPSSSVRPEDPTVDDAFKKLSTGMHLVGDIELTSRAAPSSAWLPCDGRYVSQEDYPELFNVLRTTASQGNWETQVVSVTANKSKLGDVLSYANGIWFRSRAWCDDRYDEEYLTAKMWYSSDNMNSWHEVTIPNNVLQINTVHYYAQKYVGVCLKYVDLNYYVAYILYANQPSGPWSLAAEVGDQSRYSVNEGVFSADVITDGATYYVTCSENTSIKYSSSILAASWQTSNYFGGSTSTSNYNILTRLVYNEDDGYFYSGKGTHQSGSVRLARTRTPLDYSSWQIIYNTYGSYRTVCTAGNFIFAGDADFAASVATYVYSIDGGTTFKRISLATNTSVNSVTLVDGILILSTYTSNSTSTNPTLMYSDDLDSGFVSTSISGLVEVFAGNGSGLIAGALASSGGNTQNIYRDFTYDAKKIPKIVPDSRSYAYIKAMED